MPARRKTHYVLVKVTAPKDMPAKDVRREVRTLINDQANYMADHGDIKAVSVSWIPKSWIGG